MNLRAVGWMLGGVLWILAGFLTVPAAVALVYGEYADMGAMLAAAAVSAGAGGGLAWANRGATKTAEGRPDYFRREGLAVVGLVWLVGGMVGALPYLFSGTFGSPVDAFFEAVSGFTTTGSTVMTAEQIDGLSRTIAFWRSFTHWLGGFGIVMVFVVLFPTGGRSLFRSEVPGISREAGHQRVRDSAVALMRIYVGMSVVECVLLVLCGMSLYDAALHTFGTIATGGFSNHSESIVYYRATVPAAWRIEMVIAVFMFLSGLNFAIYDVLLRVGPRPAWRRFVGSLEIRTYVALILGSSLFIGIVLWLWGGNNGDPTSPVGADYRGFWAAMLDGHFQVVCLMTSTGYATADFDQWPQVTRALLMSLAVVGACAGSTGGGIKVVRVIIVAKAAIAGVQRFIRPRAIHAVRMDGQTLEEGTVASVTGYFALWVLVFLFGTLALTLFGIDLETAATSVVATLNNIGPGLSGVGPTANFGWMQEPVKLLLSVFMILGRLEFYAVVALLVPDFWRR